MKNIRNYIGKIMCRPSVGILGRFVRMASILYNNDTLLNFRFGGRGVLASVLKHIPLLPLGRVATLELICLHTACCSSVFTGVHRCHVLRH